MIFCPYFKKKIAFCLFVNFLRGLLVRLDERNIKSKKLLTKLKFTLNKDKNHPKRPSNWDFILLLVNLLKILIIILYFLDFSHQDEVIHKNRRRPNK